MTHRLIASFLITAALAVAACSGAGPQPAEPGFIQNPLFADPSGGNGVGKPWATIQHAGEPSYLFTVRDGVLRIERVGSQPYGKVIQVLPAEKLRGKTLAFSAELSGNLEPLDNPSVPWADATGLEVIVKGYSGKKALRMLGKRVLLNATSEPGLTPGELDWTRQRVVFQVPEQATDVVVGIRLVLNGVLEARSPSLVIEGSAARN